MPKAHPTKTEKSTSRLTQPELRSPVDARRLADRLNFQHEQETKRRSRIETRLKELDQYLSPAEAKALQASARDVFKDKLLQLGVQFRFAVTEKRWHDALTIGMEIIHDFPNARMAGEVREALDTLRQRARQPASASPGQVSQARP